MSDRAIKLAWDIQQLQEKAEKTSVFAAIPLVKEATKKQAALNHLLVQAMAKD